MTGVMASGVGYEDSRGYTSRGDEEISRGIGYESKENIPCGLFTSDHDTFFDVDNTHLPPFNSAL